MTTKTKKQISGKMLTCIIVLVMSLTLLHLTASAATAYDTATLQAAIADADGTAADPTLIEITTGFAITSPITIGSDKHVKIQSQNALSPVTLTRGVKGNLFSNSGGSLTLENIIIDGNKNTAPYNAANGGGGGALVSVNGTLNMLGGAELRNNYNSNHGGGVIVNHIFNMFGGKISGNETGAEGGGVSLEFGDFTMQGGEISGNAAPEYGGGVTVRGSGGTFNMHGGIITGNTAAYVSGVRSVGELRMDGGEISGNTTTNTLTYLNRGGVYSSNTIIIGGTAKILDNKTASNDDINIEFLSFGSYITLGTGANGAAVPADGMKVGVTKDLTFDGGVFVTSASTYQAAYFFSDNPAYMVEPYSGGLRLTAFVAIDVTGVTAGTTVFPSTGGSSEITVTGTNLSAAVQVRAFNGTTPVGEYNSPTYGSDAARTGSLLLPENDGAEDVIYTVRATVDYGANWLASPTATVTVQNAGGAGNVTIAYNANGGTGTMSPAVETSGADHTVLTNGFMRDGYTFTGWNTAANGSGIAYAEGATINNVTANTTLYAQWNQNILSGTVSIGLNSATGEVIATATGGSTGSFGALTYTWSGGASGTGTTKNPTPGVPATCTVTAADASGSISATITIYKVISGTTVANGTTGTFSITTAYGEAGEYIRSDYSAGNSDGVTFASGTRAVTLNFTFDIAHPGYTVAEEDAESGVITITATFSFITQLLAGTLTLDVNPTTGRLTAALTGGNTATAGTLTYTWSGLGVLDGMTTATGTTLDPASYNLSRQITVTVTSSNHTGSVSDIITIYRVESGTTVADGTTGAFSIATTYGKLGETAACTYSAGNSQGVAFVNGYGQPVNLSGGNAVYTIDNADTDIYGVITITAIFAGVHPSGTYNAGDIAAINAIIDNNGLGWTKATPADGSIAPPDWTGVTWNAAATDKRITGLEIYSSGLTGTLNVSALTALEKLDCMNNSLTGLNVSGLASLTVLNCSDNDLPEINLAGVNALEELNCRINLLTALDVSGCIALENLDCGYNLLDLLDVSYCVDLEYLYCVDNNLTALNLSGLTELAEVDCGHNILTTLNVSGCIALESLYCEENRLGSLNLTGLTALEVFWCQINLLTTLDVSDCASMTHLYCNDNLLTGLVLNAVAPYANIDARNNNMTGTGAVTGRSIAWDTGSFYFTPQNTSGTPVAPTIVSADNTRVVTGTGGTFQVTATGSTPITYTLSGTVPTGVTINSADGLMTIAASVAVGTYSFTITASNSISPDATQNFTLTVTANGPETVVWPGYVHGLRPDILGLSTADCLFPDWLSDNTVTVNSGNIPGFVFGGVSGGADHVTGNSVIINDGTINMPVHGGFSINGDVTGNSVTVNGGTMNNDVRGGSSTNGDAKGNSVTVNGGTIASEVIGGQSQTGDATGNTVTISGSPTFTAYAGLCGGASSGDAFSGNTLNVKDYNGSAVFSVQNFRYFNFAFPATQTGPVLEATGPILLGEWDNFGSTGNGSTVSIEITGGTLAVGSTITLFEVGASGWLWTDGFTQTTVTGSGYTFDLTATAGANGKLTATVTAFNDLSLSPSTSLDFGSAVVGYSALTARTVTITNISAQPGGSLSIGLSGGSGSDFILSTNSVASIAAGGSANFTVAPKTGLSAGIYSETLTINDIVYGTTKTLNVSFTVTATAPTLYAVSFGSFSNGAVNTDKTNAAAGETVTLTLASIATGYELDVISVRRNSDNATVALSGTGAANGATRTFTMPADDVTVTATFRQTQAQADADAVDAARTAIAGATFTVAQSLANTSTTVRSWLATQINALSGVSAAGVTVSTSDITIGSGFTAATAGTSASPSGTNGSFTFTVALSKGSATATTASIAGTITATAYTPPTAYAITVAATTNGTVTSSATSATPGTTVTLSITPSAGYELDAISAYRTGVSSTTVALSGSGASRTFSMPAYGVTVTASFRKTQAQLDKEAVETLQAAIEGGTYRVAQATANDAASIKEWLDKTLNLLFGQSHGLQVRSAPLTINGGVTVSNVKPAVTGTADKPSGTNGSFTFTVNLTLGATTRSATAATGVIVATPHSGTAVKRIEITMLGDLTARVFNTGNIAADNLTLTLTGANANVFTPSASAITGLPVGGEIEIMLTPQAGLPSGVYKATLTIGGPDMTSVSADITYNVTPTGNDVVETDNDPSLRAWTIDGALHVSGLAAGSPFRVYNLSGTLIYNGTAAGESEKILLPARGVYVITDGVSTIKIIN